MYYRLTVIYTPAMARELLLGYVSIPAMGPYLCTGSKLWSQMSWTDVHGALPMTPPFTVFIQLH